MTENWQPTFKAKNMLYMEHVNGGKEWFWSDSKQACHDRFKFRKEEHCRVKGYIVSVKVW